MKKKLVCFLILSIILLSACEQNYPISDEISTNNTYIISENEFEYSMDNVTKDLGNGFYIVSDYSEEERADSNSEAHALVFVNSRNKIKVIYRYNRYDAMYGNFLGYYYLVTEDAVYYINDVSLYKVSKNNPYDNKLFFPLAGDDQFKISALLKYENDNIVCGGMQYNTETEQYVERKIYIADDGSGEYHISGLK